MVKESEYIPDSIFSACCGSLTFALALTSPVTAEHADMISTIASSTVGPTRYNENEEYFGSILINDVRAEWDRICRDFEMSEVCKEVLKNQIIGEGFYLSEFTQDYASYTYDIMHGSVENMQKDLVVKLSRVIVHFLINQQEDLKDYPWYIWDRELISYRIAVRIVEAAWEISNIIVEAVESVLNNYIELEDKTEVDSNGAANKEELNEISDTNNKSKNLIDEIKLLNSALRKEIFYRIIFLNRISNIKAIYEFPHFYMYPNSDNTFEHSLIPTDYKTVRAVGGEGASVKIQEGLGINDVNNICNIRYGNNRRVIVIVLARYSIRQVKEMVDDNYEYWHYYSEKDADFFWLGYYLDYYQRGITTQFKLANDGNICSLAFDSGKYAKEVKMLSGILNQSLGHVTGYLICDYYEGEIHFNNSVLVKIEELLKQDKGAVLREVTDCLFNACSREKEAKNVGTIIKNEMRLSAMKEKAGEFTSTFLSGAGFVLQFL